MERDPNGLANPEHPPIGNPITIEYTDEAMEGIRAAVVEGLYKLSRNGLEVGGLLLGQIDGDMVRILDSRPIVCEHSYGPSFQLSQKDEAALDAQLSSLAADAASGGLSLVGWYRSSIRAGIRLTERDRALWDRCFPGPSQVALILHPERMKPTQAGFFLRPPGSQPGELSPSFVFEVVPSVREQRPIPPTAPPTTSGLREVGPDPAPTPQAQATEATPPATAAPRRALFWFLFALAWCIAAVSLAFGLREFWLPARTPPLALQLTELAGQVVVKWDPSDSLIRQADSGVLEVEDAGKKTTLRLDQALARGGSITYARASGDVTVRLTLVLPRGRTVKGAARIVVQPAVQPGLAPTAPAPSKGNPARTGASSSAAKAAKKATPASRRRPRRRAK